MQISKFQAHSVERIAGSQSLYAKRYPLNAKTFWIFIFAFYLFTFIGCTTIPEGAGVSTYDINGVTYLPLISLCNSKGINWQYDTFTKTVTLTKSTHRINLMVGDRLVLVDGVPTQLRHPVDLYQGVVVVPYKFKEQVLDGLFKELYPYKKPASLPSSRIKKIVLDAGHGGNDPGAIGRAGLREKYVNLDIVKRLVNLLKAQGFEVITTRNSDRFIPLSRRVDIANGSKADLFISIHSNANRVRSLSGLEVYYCYSDAKSDAKRALSAAQSASLNLSNAHFASYSLNLKATLWDMIYTYNRAESVALARSICRVVGRNSGTDVLGIKSARFYVLQGVRMPAVLIEVGFLSNYREERMLKNSYYRQEIAELILRGIGNYIEGSALMEASR